MPEEILLCTDLDRTVLPNGRQPESPAARPLLRAAAEHESFTLVYVSGRDRRLLLEAIDTWQLPLPAYAIGDVGTTLYEVRGGHWRPWPAWETAIAPDWGGREQGDLATLFTDLSDLRLQEPEKQGRFKLSYYAAPELERDAVLAEMGARLEDAGVRAGLVWSVDETRHLGLLDVLPAGANKLHAIRFLMGQRGVDESGMVFAGDSGNDLPVLTSGLQAVLVANATEEVRREALARAAEGGRPERLYLARGGFLGMNGNYTAGVLEGLAHFRPETRDWLEEAARRLG